MSNSSRRKYKAISVFCPNGLARFMTAGGDLEDVTDGFTISTDMEREGVSRITAGQHLAHRFEGLGFSNCPTHERW